MSAVEPQIANPGDGRHSTGVAANLIILGIVGVGLSMFVTKRIAIVTRPDAPVSRESGAPSVSLRRRSADPVNGLTKATNDFIQDVMTTSNPRTPGDDHA